MSTKPLPKYLVKQFEVRAKNEREAGSTISINHLLPYVAIHMCNDDEYFFQGEEAEALIDDVPENINEDDFILACAQDW